MYLELELSEITLNLMMTMTDSPLDSPRLNMCGWNSFIILSSAFFYACTHLNMFDRYNCSKMLQFFAIIIFLIMIDRDIFWFYCFLKSSFSGKSGAPQSCTGWQIRSSASGRRSWPLLCSFYRLFWFLLFTKQIQFLPLV